MRDQPLMLPFGSGPVRKFFLSVLAIFMALFALITLPAPTAKAQAADGAVWNGTAINYDGHQYIPMGQAKAGESHGIQEGSMIYAYTEPAAPGQEDQPRKAHLMYFAPGTDPPTATSATLKTYDLQASKYSNPSAAKTITIAPRTDSSVGTDSCKVEGIGWIVCPVTKFMAGAMDWLYDILSSFLEVRAVQTNQDNALFRAWGFMRNFANVAFVIGFLVVIYSQLSGVGISNYGIKKVLPRLIIAAILVNVSYWICAVAIDVSNILGYSVQDIFINMRNNIVGEEGNGWDLGWTDLSAYILAGGAITGGAIGLYALSAATISGAIYMLLPILVGVVLAALIALLVMALRQAIITVLVVVSPLAFVAYLLPNTEKYFEKWRELFTTMLVLFPVFSVIFGGSQLAGLLIIQNADSIGLIILGMAVQVAPIVITPLLVKFSGSLIGRIAGMVNNPNKGLIDRTRNWSREQAGEHKARVLANTPKKGIRGFTARRAQGIDARRRKGKEWKEANEAYADARWANGDEYRKIHAARERANTLKETGENTAQTYANLQRTAKGSRFQADETNLHVSKLRLDASKIHLEAMQEELNAGHAPASGLTNHARYAQEATRDLALTAMRKQAAERTQKSDLTKALSENTDIINGTTLREYAGGIRGVEGASSVLAATIAAARKEYGEKIGEKAELMRHFNLASKDYQTLALGTDVQKVKDGVSYTFSSKDEYSREAAISRQLKAGSESEKIDIIKESGMTTDASGNIVKGKTYDYRTTISADIPANGIPAKSLIFGSKIIDDVGQGKVYGETGLNNAAAYHIMEGKISDDVLATQGAGTLKILFESWDKRHTIPQYAQASATKKAEFARNYQALRESAGKIVDDPINRNASEASRTIFEQYRT